MRTGYLATKGFPDGAERLHMLGQVGPVYLVGRSDGRGGGAGEMREGSKLTLPLSGVRPGKESKNV